MRAFVRVCFAVVLSLAAGCAREEPAAPVPQTPKGLFEVVARGLEFSAPDRIPSGWVTFRFRNESPMTHFAVVEKLPEGIGVAEQQEQVAPVFQEGMNLLIQGDEDAAMKKFGELPEWFGKVAFLGGPGLTGPGQTSETVVHLEPGSYMLECYVKTAGTFHSYNPQPGAWGMVHGFTVTDEASGAPEPAATVTVTLSGERGIEVAGDVAAGERTVAVHFEDQRAHENFVGHDLHLVRLADDTDLDQLAAWMDWRRPHGLETPAPAMFLGGTQEMPAGSTAYVKVRFEPGRYAWIAEVPDAASHNLLQTFTVAGP